MKGAARLGGGNRYWRTPKSACLNAENRKVEPKNQKSRALKSENVYVFFRQKDALNFDSYQFFAYFCNQKRKLIFKDTNHNYIKTQTAETFKNSKAST